MAGLFAVSVAADSIAVRLDGIRTALARVATGDIAQDLEIDDGGEGGERQAGFSQMVHGLRERQQLQDLFGRHRRVVRNGRRRQRRQPRALRVHGANWTARGTVGLRGRNARTHVYGIGTGVSSLRG